MKLKKWISDLGEAPTSTSLVKRSGLLREAIHPIIPDIECPTNTVDFNFISSTTLIRSSANASYEVYLHQQNISSHFKDRICKDGWFSTLSSLKGAENLIAKEFHFI